MKSIHTLVPDIRHFIETNEDWYERVMHCFGGNTKSSVQVQPEHRGLRLSGLGDKCPRALWYSIHHPEMAESLPASAKFKYGYGHVIEALALQLARLAGHSVEGEQDELVVDGIIGHRDAVVDGCVVDVKSCSSIAFNKYADGSFSEASDDFGYLYQLDGYVLGSQMDPIVTDKSHGYIFAIDKTLGHMTLYEHTSRHDRIRSRIAYYKFICELTEPPGCDCGTRADKTTGLTVLDVRASYSPYKHCCFPNLRTEMIKGKPYYVPGSAS